MKKKLVGTLRLRAPNNAGWLTYNAEFDIESETNPEQEAWDRKRARADERTKRGDDLAREFLRSESATFITCLAPTRAAIVHILDTELPLL